MMEIKEKNYVRTKNGLIFKIIGGNVDNWDLDISYDMLETFEENWLELYRYNDNGSFFDNKNIVKSRPDIIDLIEVGDYVNGYRITNLDISIGGKTIRLFTDEPDIYAENIKSIVTKEQFESMKYEVK